MRISGWSSDVCSSDLYAASLTMGAGQFCTNPGLVIALEGSDLDAFVGAAAAALGQSPAQQMLTPAIHSAFGRGVDALSGHDAVETLARGPAGEGANQAQAALFGADRPEERRFGNECVSTCRSRWRP